MADVHKSLLERRDLSEDSVKTLYERNINPPLGQGQRLVAKVLFSVDDTYGVIEDDKTLVFDSSKAENVIGDAKTIKQILENLNVLDITIMDKFMCLLAEV